MHLEVIKIRIIKRKVITNKQISNYFLKISFLILTFGGGRRWLSSCFPKGLLPSGFAIKYFQVMFYSWMECLFENVCRGGFATFRKSKLLFLLYNIYKQQVHATGR